MSNLQRGKDAQDQAPATKPSGTPPTEGPGKGAEQDAANYETTDRGKAIAVEDMSSANDEGAN